MFVPALRSIFALLLADIADRYRYATRQKVMDTSDATLSTRRTRRSLSAHNDVDLRVLTIWR